MILMLGHCIALVCMLPIPASAQLLYLQYSIWAVARIYFKASWGWIQPSCTDVLTDVGLQCVFLPGRIKVDPHQLAVLCMQACCTLIHLFHFCISCWCFQSWLLHYLDWTFNCHTQSISSWWCQHCPLQPAAHCSTASGFQTHVATDLLSWLQGWTIVIFKCPRSGQPALLDIPTNIVLWCCWYGTGCIFLSSFMYAPSSLSTFAWCSNWLGIAFWFVCNASWLGLSVFYVQSWSIGSIRLIPDPLTLQQEPGCLWMIELVR